MVSRKKSPGCNHFVIRCITESTKGFGNLNRCLIIAKLLKNKKFEILFVIDKNSKAKKIILNHDFNCEELRKSQNQISYLQNLAKDTHFKYLLLDMREQGEHLAKKLHNNDFKLIQFDDAWCKNVFADLYFNGLLSRKRNSLIKKNPNSKIFVGGKFWISETNFALHKKLISSIKNKTSYTITISLGGVDPNNLTQFILNSIVFLPNIKIFVVIGPFFKTIAWKKNYQFKTNVKIVENNFSLWEIFQHSDIVFCSAGNTIFDLIIQRVPTICIPIVKHQNTYAKYLHSKNLTFNLGSPSQLSKIKIRNSLNLILKNPKKRKEISQNGSMFLDGKGQIRVISKILE